MIDRGHDLPIAQQAKALGISRGSVYYLPRAVPAAELAVMRRMDEQHLERQFSGSRTLRDLLNTEGIKIGRCHVATPMKRLRIAALCRKAGRPTPSTERSRVRGMDEFDGEARAPPVQHVHVVA